MCACIGDGELLSSPVLSGRLLVWTLHRSGSGGAVELWAARPPHARPFALISSTRRVNGDEEDGEGGTTEAPARVRLRDLDASANQVVWLERAAVESASGGADDRIWLYDMAAGAASRIMAPAGPKSAVAVDAGLIVWAGRGDNLGVWVHDTATDQRLRVATSLASSVDISGSRVVWSTATGDVYGFDLRTRRRFSVCQAAGMQADVHIDGELIVWWDGRAAHSEGTGSAGGRVRGDIYAFDLSSGKEVAVCTDKAAQESPRVSGDTVVWLDDRSGRWQVRGAIVRR
jgi:beta propeller repeat protein